MYDKLPKPLKGADISYVQKGFDFAAAKSYGIRFVIIRAGIATSTDSQLYSHIRGAKAAGIPFGFYWYSYAMNVNDAKSEAAACLSAIKKYKPEYPVFYDMERNQQVNSLDTRTRTDIVKAFCDATKAGGYPCGIYANPSWLLNYLYKDELIGKYDLWLAAWTDDPNDPTNYDFGQSMWQWGVDKIAGMDTDGDLCYVDYPAITKEFYAQHGSKPEPPTPPIKPPTPAVKFSVGDKVRVKSGAKTYNGEPLASFVYDNVYTVMQVGIVGKPDYIVIGVNGQVTAAVKAADLSKVTVSTPTYKVGEKVKVKKGAKTYNGEPLASFVYDNVYTVMQVGIVGKPDYIVIGVNGQVTAAVKAADLIKISS